MQRFGIILFWFLSILSATASAQQNAEDETNPPTPTIKTRPIPAEFARYPGAPVFNAKPALPVLDSRAKRRFRTVLRNGSQEAANFNGHHRLVIWGCGMNCIGWAIVNQRNGQVWMGDYGASSCWAYQREDQENSEIIPDWFEISLNSRMFYAYACDDDSGRYIFNKRKVYLWQNGQPKLLRVDQVKF